MKKLLCLLCVIALLGAVCVPAMADTARVPVVAEVPADWTTAYLYAWGGAEEMAWPGVPMTNIDGWWVAYMNDDMANVIINNGSGIQTPDLVVDMPGLPVCVLASDVASAKVESELPIEVPAEDAMPKPATDTVYALVPDAWATAYLYAWTADASSSNAGWPGVEMTKGEDGLWVGELGPGFANVIIAEKDGGAQTVDLPYNGGEAWVLLKAEAGADGKFEANIHYEKPETIEHPTEIIAPVPGDVPTSDAWYVAGTMNEWNCADEAYKMTDNGDGTFSYTFSVTAGNHALKVTNGTWDVSFGGNGADGNYEFGATADGEITVNYDGNGVVTVTGDVVGEAQPGGDAPAATGNTWYVAGTMNEWNCADEAYKMTDNGDGTFSLVFAMTAGAHQLKVTNGTWDVSFGGDGENGNYDFNVSADGNVTVTFDGTTVTVQEGDVAPEAPEATEGDAEPEATDAAEPSEGKDDEGGKKGNGTMIGIIISVVVVLVGAVAVFFVLKKK